MPFLIHHEKLTELVELLKDPKNRKDAIKLLGEHKNEIDILFKAVKDIAVHLQGISDLMMQTEGIVNGTENFDQSQLAALKHVIEEFETNIRTVKNDAKIIKIHGALAE